MAGSPQHGQLAAGAVSPFTFDLDYDQVEVLNRDGTAEIYFTVDGTEPTVGGTGCEVLPAAMGSIVVAAPNAPGAGGGTVVKCISTGTPKVSVKGL
jgi:hypothetical protein